MASPLLPLPGAVHTEKMSSKGIIALLNKYGESMRTKEKRPKSQKLQRIRMRAVIWLLLACTAVNVWADEKLPVLQVGSKVYSNVTVTTVTATDIYFTFDKGVANAKLKNLDSALQKHFHFDAEAVKAAEAAALASRPAQSEQTIDHKNAQATMDAAIAQVKAIVNQPVRQVARPPGVVVFKPGWFHTGAEKPDYKDVDVRKTQDTQLYERMPYVTSALNPGVAFVGSEIEFNPMTKYFYDDLSLPKKRLTEPEMVEINRLYRIIGTCEEKLQPEQSGFPLQSSSPSTKKLSSSPEYRWQSCSCSSAS